MAAHLTLLKPAPPPNPWVIERLKHLLAEAETGRLQTLAYVIIEDGNTVHDFDINEGYEANVFMALHQMASEVRQSVFVDET